MNPSCALRSAWATGRLSTENALWKATTRRDVLCDSTSHREPTTDPAPLIRNADVRPRIPTPSRELPTEESHEASTTTEFGRIFCFVMSMAVTLLGLPVWPSSRIADRSGSEASWE